MLLGSEHSSRASKEPGPALYWDGKATRGQDLQGAAPELSVGAKTTHVKVWAWGKRM